MNFSIITDPCDSLGLLIRGQGRTLCSPLTGLTECSAFVKLKLPAANQRRIKISNDTGQSSVQPLILKAD